jgi:hypothetical protein
MSDGFSSRSRERVKYLGKERAATVRNAGIEAGLLCADHPPRQVSLAVEAARLAHTCRVVHSPGRKKKLRHSRPVPGFHTFKQPFSDTLIDLRK